MDVTESTQAMTVEINYAPGLDTDSFCRCCARAAQKWRNPEIVAEVLKIGFLARRFTTLRTQHHHSVASKKDYRENQECVFEK